MSDGACDGSLLKVSAAAGTVRALAAVTTRVVEDARRRHGTYPTATAALGRTLTGALLLGGTMKDEERLSIELVGDGPLRRVMASTTGAGRVRGYVAQPATHLPPKHGKLDVAAAIGSGILCVIRTQPWNKEPYRSIMRLVSGEIAQDLAHYLVTSEQIPSAVALGVFVNREGDVGAAGGFLVQMMSGAEEGVMRHVERNVAALPQITTLIREGATSRDILDAVLAGLDTSPLAEQSTCFACPCTRECVFGAILLLGRTEIADMIARDGGAEVTCEFCAERYAIGADELRMLIAEPEGTA
ncbi:MAG: Hsp33 family molecular chaperone HslO [Deltaproteobacteria bacterium]|nr:Hsp33 family molecular chaperone HslO [Deltaproteobacteria bacterium]